MANTEVPEWFQKAIDTSYTEHRVEAYGCDIHYQAWGDPSKPGLYFLHGNGAHSHWWDFIAPSFADDFYVVAPCMSGMGDSGYRDVYNVATYVEEIKETCDAIGFVDKPLLVGHSMGGRLVFAAEKKYRDAFYGVIIADSSFPPPERKFNFEERRKAGVKPHKIYETADEALSRFRLFPPQPCDNEYIVKFIGQHSMRQVDGGWSWKFDPKVFSQFDYENMLSSMPEEGEKVLGMIYGADSSLFTGTAVEYNENLFAKFGFRKPIPIANAHHHLFLDQPLAFIEELQNLIADTGYGK
ncbi:alpha/beta hydrolase [Aurantivibrio plasticivorans]